ncbi:MAG: SpoIIE family protein phosphatase [Chloroflexia bacterium]|nr:SpoIIE family protein phosphatase [Chloroflexia bacterium]
MEFGVVQRPKIGRRVCGDGHLILEEDSRVLVAVTDGLGSGPKAYHSTELALQGVAEHADADLIDIMTYCHYTILAAGGVGVMIALLRLVPAQSLLEIGGVGNVRFLAHSQEVIQPIIHYGYLGVRLPSMRSYRFSYHPGDIFLLHTDGISSRFHLENHVRELDQEGPQALADLALREYGKMHDDATLVLARA